MDNKVLLQLNTGLSKIGEVIFGEVNHVYIPHGTFLEVGKIDLTAGLWIIVTQLQFSTVVLGGISLGSNRVLGEFRISHLVSRVITGVPITAPLYAESYTAVDGGVYVEDGSIWAIRIA